VSQQVLRAPGANDNKYTRGIVTLLTGSTTYPGAALLSVGAAWATGIGMVRYLGPESVRSQVLQSYPETVFVAGRTDCTVAGAGRPEPLQPAELEVLAASRFAVIDAGALETIDFELTPAATILTPHTGELQKLQVRVGLQSSDDPKADAIALAEATKRFVLLKGSTTWLAAPDGTCLPVGPNSPWLATAGTGDVLAGILGALLAANSSDLTDEPDRVLQVVEMAVRIHSRAAELAAFSGPVSSSTVLANVRRACLEFIS
jgi:hydroxyethylthiazole kinase-like uncharacterized protein yjeF